METSECLLLLVIAMTKAKLWPSLAYFLINHHYLFSCSMATLDHNTKKKINLLMIFEQCGLVRISQVYCHVCTIFVWVTVCNIQRYNRMITEWANVNERELQYTWTAKYLLPSVVSLSLSGWDQIWTEICSKTEIICRVFEKSGISVPTDGNLATTINILTLKGWPPTRLIQNSRRRLFEHDSD